MNFSSEKNKPIFVARPVQLNASNSTQFINEALANSTVVRALHSGDYMIKASAAKRFLRSSMVSIDDATPAEAKELIVSRLESEQQEQFRFLDGRIFSGPEAAREVSRGTEVGQYFVELEKETLRIVQEAFFRGELN